MDRRRFLKLTGAGLASSMWPVSLGCSRDAGAGSRPNVLVICSDQHQAAKMGHRPGSGVKTPNLDRLAAEGAEFTRAYCNSPLCGPSRMSLMTGMYVHELGTWLNGARLPAGVPTWADELSRAGYTTSAAGKMGVVGTRDDYGFVDFESRARHPVYVPWPMQSPFDFRLEGSEQAPWWFDQPPQSREKGVRVLERQGAESEGGLYFGKGAVRKVGYYDQDREATNQTIARLAERRAQGTAPWLHFLGLTMPHWPYVSPEKYLQMYDPEKIDVPAAMLDDGLSLHPSIEEFVKARPFEIDERRLRKVIATYYAMITCMDDMVGEVLAELDRGGQSSNTYVIYMSDHGESLGTHGLFGKQTSYAESVEVPLIVRGPGIAPGTVIGDPVGLVDLFPTLLDMGGVGATTSLAGTNQLPRLIGGAAPENEVVLSEYHGGYMRRDWFMIVAGDFKYTHYVGERPSLFDLASDPNEQDDVAMDPAYAETLREMEALLRSMVDVDAVALQAKTDLGLIGPDGEDYTETLTIDELRTGRREGRFKPRFASRMIP